MATPARDVLDAFDALAPEDKERVAAEILRRCEKNGDLTDGTLGDAMARAARLRTVQAFDIEECTMKLEQLYDKIASDGTGTELGSTRVESHASVSANYPTFPDRGSALAI